MSSVQTADGGSAGVVPEVVLPDADPRAFELVLSYIYTDRILPTKQGNEEGRNDNWTLISLHD